jgi:PAS domain S-box-containing protein
LSPAFEPRTPRQLTLTEAASILSLPVEGVEALVGAGYLTADEGVGDDGPFFALGDLKAFLARNSRDDGDGTDVLDDLFADTDPTELLELLDERTDDMARRAFDVLASAFPEATAWPDGRRERFIDQARDRFEAILAIAGNPDVLADDLVAELAEVGAAAAWAESPLPEVLLTLRISRDLVVQTAVEVAEDRGRHWGMALTLLLTRVLPALDRLTDAVARGYWAAVVAREEESSARYAHVVEHSSDGVFEIDLDGVIVYANASFAVIVGHPGEELSGRPLVSVLVPAEPGVSLRPLLSRAADGEWVELVARRADGVHRVLDVRATARRSHDAVVGHAGVVRDVTGARELEQQKNDFLALITHELRHPLTTILGLGVTLDTYADDLTRDRVRKVGTSIHQQAERIARLADDLFDVSRLQSNTLLLNFRDVDLRGVVDAALGMLERPAGVEVRIPAGTEVRADGRRLEQVLAHLIENAVVHGAPPVLVDVEDSDREVTLSVRDHGPGVPAGAEATLLSRLHPTDRGLRRSDRRSGLGLVLVRGLVEAMGGRVWYESADDGGACFNLALPVAGRTRRTPPDA